jgi:hypothetical protein
MTKDDFFHIWQKCGSAPAEALAHERADHGCRSDPTRMLIEPAIFAPTTGFRL